MSDSPARTSRTLPNAPRMLPMFFAPAHVTWNHGLATQFSTLALDLAPAAAVDALKASGVLAQLVPAALGGRVFEATSAESLDVRALCLTREALAYRNPMADSIFAVTGLGCFALVKTAAFEGRNAILGEVARGERVGAFALTEPEAGTDVASMRMRARREGDTWVLNGEKIYISNVGIADHYLVFANAAPELGKKGISGFFVPKGTQGMTEQAIPVSDGHPLGRLIFNECIVPASALIGEVGQGMRLALGTLDTFRVSVAAAACGIAQRALDETLARVTQRVQFGKPLATFQLTQAALATMQTELSAARLLTYLAAFKKDAGESASREVAEAKLFATEAGQRIVDRAVQLHGGSGVVLGSVVEHLYRSIRALRIYEGTSEIQQLIIAGELLKS